MIFKDKFALLIPGVRGLSNEHAEDLADRFRKAGGRVIMPDKGKSFYPNCIFSGQRKSQRGLQRSYIYYYTKD